MSPDEIWTPLLALVESTTKAIPQKIRNLRKVDVTINSGAARSVQRRYLIGKENIREYLGNEAPIRSKLRGI